MRRGRSPEHSRPLEIRPKAGGGALAASAIPALTHINVQRVVANSGVRAPLGQKKGAARFPIGRTTATDRGPVFPARLQGTFPQLTTVTARRFCAQASSVDPTTAGRSLP